MRRKLLSKHIWSWDDAYVVDAINMQSICSQWIAQSALAGCLLGDKAPTRKGPCIHPVGRHKLKAFQESHEVNGRVKNNRPRTRSTQAKLDRFYIESEERFNPGALAVFEMIAACFRDLDWQSHTLTKNILRARSFSGSYVPLSKRKYNIPKRWSLRTSRYATQQVERSVGLGLTSYHGLICTFRWSLDLRNDWR